MAIDYAKVPSPCFVLDETRLIKNLEIIERVQQDAGVEVILAFKGFAMWSAFPKIREYISGATASSLNEAKLCSDKMKSKAHTYAVAYAPDEFDEICSLSSHLTFNSLSQFGKFKDQLRSGVGCGLRINPEWSDVTTDLYNPASSSSRLGITAAQMPYQLPEQIDGLHFHVLCESDSYALERVLENVESKFGRFLGQIKWINMGGGHLMTQDDYDLDHLISMLKRFKSKHDLEIILEPGAAFVWQTGELVATVLDIVDNGGIRTAILDASFTCHMPDTLEMPYRPNVMGASADASEFQFAYRLGGVSCLAGDFLEAYSFKQELGIDDRIIFRDMMHYTMVKTTMFNGVKHPSIGLWREENFELLRAFDYGDYLSRMA